MEQPPSPGVGKHKLRGALKAAGRSPQVRGDIHGRNLSKRGMIKVAEEMEEMKRVRNKLMIMHWKARGRPSLSYLMCSALNFVSPDVLSLELGFLTYLTTSS